MLAAVALLPLGGWAPANAPLEVKVSNVRVQKGTAVHVAVYPKDGFLKSGKHVAVQSMPANAATVRFNFNLPPGSYALAIFHDLNSNNKLDRKWIGLPDEPYGFSRNFKPRFGPPEFSDCSFELSAAGASQEVRLIR